MRASRRVRAKLRWFIEFLRVFFDSGRAFEEHERQKKWLGVLSSEVTRVDRACGEECDLRGGQNRRRACRRQIYVELMPCIECERAIIQAGISEVIVSEDRMSRYQSDKYSEQHVLAELMLREAGVSVRRA